MKITKLTDKFAKAIKDVLENSEVDTHVEGDVWNRDGADGHSFVMKYSAIDHYYGGLDLLKDNILENKYKNNEQFFNRLYYQFIWSRAIKRDNLYQECRNWLEYLEKLKTANFKILLPISYYYSERDIELGNLKIIKLNKDTLLHYFGTPKAYDLLMYLEKDVECPRSDTYAIVDVEAFDRDGAREAAYSIVEKFAHAIRFIDSKSHMLFGKANAVRLSEVSVDKSDTELLPYINHDNIPMSVYLDTKLDKSKAQWDRLTSFLYAKNPTNLQNVILGALYWFGVSDNYRDSKKQLFLNYIIGLELIILHDYGQHGKANQFIKNYKKIFSGLGWTIWEEVYKKRNRIVHGGSVDIDNREVEKMEMDLHYLLWHLVELTDKYDDLSDVLKEEYGIDNKNIPRKQETCSGHPNSN